MENSSSTSTDGTPTPDRVDPADAKVFKSFWGKQRIRYDCPKCNVTLTNPLEEAGQLDVCPECNIHFFVPVHPRSKNRQHYRQTKHLHSSWDAHPDYSFSENQLSKVLKKYNISDRGAFLEHAMAFDENDNQYLDKEELEKAAAAFKALASSKPEKKKRLNKSEKKKILNRSINNAWGVSLGLVWFPGFIWGLLHFEASGWHEGWWWRFLSGVGFGGVVWVFLGMPIVIVFALFRSLYLGFIGERKQTKPRLDIDEAVAAIWAGAVALVFLIFVLLLYVLLPKNTDDKYVFPKNTDDKYVDEHGFEWNTYNDSVPYNMTREESDAIKNITRKNGGYKTPQQTDDMRKALSKFREVQRAQGKDF